MTNGRRALGSKNPATRVEILPLPAAVGVAAPTERKFFGERFDFVAHALGDGFIVEVVEHFGNPAADPAHLGLFHTARGDSGGTDADAARGHRRARLERVDLLVDGDCGGAWRLLA